MAPPPPSRRLVGVSTKMYFSFARTKSYIDALTKQLSTLSPEPRSTIQETTDVFVIPDHVALTTVIQQLSSSPDKILVGAQDAFHEDAGAFTGEVSPAVLSEVGCRLLEINHAERRRLFGETDESAAKKAVAAARNGLVPLICVGETTKPPATTTQEEGGLDVSAAMSEIRAQIEAVLAGLPASSPVILAYEPVWAIGAPAPASPAYVVSVARAIRELDCVRRRFEHAGDEGIAGGDEFTKTPVRILYGGSAGPGLFAHLKSEVDGLFLGRFAHDPEMFVKTILEVASA
ncbi:mitochondrial triosephosphate isomerase [Poronia punctata]|nr:mitochondrial triosephosphate isomerase [Poronia punctata]